MFGMAKMHRLAKGLAGLALALMGVAPRDAAACGGSGPGGTGGCEFRLDRPREPRIGASVVATDTTMLFGDGRRAQMERLATFASLGWPLSRRLTFEASLGATLGGKLETPGGTVSLLPGAASAVGLTGRVLDEGEVAPFVVAGLTLSGSTARARDAARSFEAYDLRASAIVGKTLARTLAPYVLGRAFGGPAFWRWDDGARVQGTDLHKLQLGAGLALSLGPVDLFVEAVPVGERSLAAGFGIRP